jgi:hypothetical protein
VQRMYTGLLLVSLGFRSSAAQFRHSNATESGFQIVKYVSYIKQIVFFCSKETVFS